MTDPYLYKGTNVLKNRLGIRNKDELEKAEGDYVSLNLRFIVEKPIEGMYDFNHFCKFHKKLFQDVYEWAGLPRTINIEKEERALGGWSIEYTKASNIQTECTKVLEKMRSIQWINLSLDERVAAFSDCLAKLWKVHSFREGNTRTVITFMCQFYEYFGWQIDRSLFEENSLYVRDSLVAYNAVFEDMGDLSRPDFLKNIVKDAIIQHP